MGKRINLLKESPCLKCGKYSECVDKALKNNQFNDIIDQVFGNKGFDYHSCPLYIALTAPDMVDES